MRKVVVVVLSWAGFSCGDAVQESSPETELGAQMTDAGRADASVRAPSAGDAAIGRGAIVDAGLVRADAATEGAGVPCVGVDTSASPAALHAAAADILTTQTPCGFSACHTGSRPKAGLRLSGVTDLRAQLVDKPACESSTVPLVSGVGGAAALAKSWLWLKLTAETTGGDALAAQAAWGTSMNCGQVPDEPYGRLMPLGAGALADDELKAVRSWICAGAPGPK